MTKVKTLNSDCGGGGGGAAVEDFPLKGFDALFGVIEVVWLPSTVGAVAVVLLAEIFRGGGVAPFWAVNSEVVDDVERTEIVVKHVWKHFIWQNKYHICDQQPLKHKI